MTDRSSFAIAYLTQAERLVFALVLAERSIAKMTNVTTQDIVSIVVSSLIHDSEPCVLPGAILELGTSEKAQVVMIPEGVLTVEASMEETEAGTARAGTEVGNPHTEKTHW